MSLRRFGAVFGMELSRELRRPLFWILVLVLALTAWGLTSGHMRISSGDSEVGGQKAWLTSEFANGQMQSLVVFLFFSFFMSVAAGMSVIRDDEMQVGGLLHSSGLRPGEYIWGKYLAVVATYLITLGAWLAFAIVCNHMLPNAAADKFRGPFELMSYLRPAIIFGLPTILFVCGAAFGAGAITRKPILVFLSPVFMLVVVGFFLWDWSPSWLAPGWNNFLILIEPAGYRWLSETWLKVDRGVAFYNQSAIPPDGLLVANRLLFTALGLGSVALAHGRFVATLRGTAQKAGRKSTRLQAATPATSAPAHTGPAVAHMGMTAAAPGMLRGAWDVMRFELRGLMGQPGLYLFVPLILMQTIGDTLLQVGAFDTPVLITPGQFAVGAMNTLSLCICLLMMFYTVESLERERSSGLAAIYYATPVRTWAVMIGKGMANSLVGVTVMMAAWLGGTIIQLFQGKVSLSLMPFVIVWGLLLVPTFLAWSAFVSAAYALSRSRYAAYAVGLATLIFTGWRQLSSEMNWVGNWMLWNVVPWSDLGIFEIDRRALWLNRIAMLGLAALLFTLTARLFPRREFDSGRIVQRLSPGALGRAALRLSPLVLVPAIALVTLWFQVNAGYQGEAMKNKAKDYWKKNLATWREAKLPDITDVELSLTLEPARRWFRTEGTYTLGNFLKEPLAQIPLTGGLHWENITWTVDGQPVTPDDRQKLFVFTLPEPLAPGGRVRIGFAYDGVLPPGISENGGTPTDEFILPSGVVLTGFSSSFAPVVGWVETLGVDEKNEYEPRVFTDDFYLGQTRSAFGNIRPYPTKITVTGPEEYQYNSVGTLESESVQNGRRTAVWRSDHPVSFFNVVAGRWEVKKGEGTAIYYYPGHTYNIEEMSQALDASRRWYSEWFYPYPWAELKVSEFPALARYAQGFPTNITFSEAIGFTTRSTAKSRAAFFVTAHEAAHQWWGNILTPGEGPGGQILSEGMANFSTIMLMEQARGPQARIEFCKRIEDQYGERRQVDSERPMVRINERRAGDTTVMYDKGSWVFWMLQQLMGRDANLEGLRDFVATWSQSPDHPVLQDFVATMRPHAPDPDAFDAFVKQWFFDVVIPEYRIESAGSQAEGDGWVVTATVENVGSGRMPVEVAAAKGDRFVEQTEEQAAHEIAAQAPDYRDARTWIVLGAGEKAQVRLRCDFEPDRIEVDPDALVLQLKRKNAVAKL